MSRFTAPLVTALIVLLCAPASSLAAREIPAGVGLANVNDQNLRDSRWLYAIRFVLDRDTTMHRFFSQMKAKGASWDEHGTRCSTYGSGCYGAGDGGRINARLVTVKPDGTPDMSNVLAEETVNPRDRYAQTKAAYGISTISLFWYFNTDGVALKANTPYAMVYRNVHPDPAHNFSSTNSPVVKASEAGPNGRNNLDPNAPGAIAGLDPREAVAWSTDSGASWKWGREVGPYQGSTSSDDGTRLPHYAWQATPTSTPESNQPYTAYWSTCSACSLTLRSAPRATTLTEAGGYAPVGKSVGVVAVKNLRTGETARTASLGSGIARGALDRPLRIEAGDSYELTNSGTVYRAEADQYLVQIVGLGSGAFPFTTSGNGPDLAELFALPHPYFRSLAAAGPAPAPGVRTKKRSKRRPALRLRVAKASLKRARRRAVRSARRGHRRVIRRLRVRGRVAGGTVRRRAALRRHRRVAVQVRRGGHWHTVKRVKLRRGGRFRMQKRLRMLPRRRALPVRAVIHGVDRSNAVRARSRR